MCTRSSHILGGNADDIDISRGNQDLQNSLSEIEKAAGVKGLKVNASKTEYTCWMLDEMSLVRQLRSEFILLRIVFNNRLRSTYIFYLTLKL